MMIDLGPHASFIIIAYLGVAIVTLALIISNIAQYKKQKNRVKSFEDKG